MNGSSVLSYPVEIAKIGAEGTTYKIEATASERAQLVADLGLVDIVALSAEMTLTRGKTGETRVEGRVRADIVQNCVVSLDPVPQTVDEAISRQFVEDGSRLAPVPPKPAAEVKIEPMEEEEPPDILTGPTIDLGTIVVEHFILAIDPYPRAPGAALPENPAEDAGGDSPFAALAKIRGSGAKGD
jgi:uncharacterized metal-binding protein YceD (DUF177 family)